MFNGFARQSILTKGCQLSTGGHSRNCGSNLRNDHQKIHSHYRRRILFIRNSVKIGMLINETRFCTCPEQKRDTLFRETHASGNLANHLEVCSRLTSFTNANIRKGILRLLMDLIRRSNLAKGCQTSTGGH